MKKTLRFVLAVVVAGLGLIVIIAACSTPEQQLPQSPRRAHASPQQTTSQPKPKSDTYEDGAFKVGTDIPAGTYKTDGPPEHSYVGCYWERSADASGELDKIIANDYIDGPSMVTIKPGEVVKFTGNCTWIKIN